MTADHVHFQTADFIKIFKQLIKARYHECVDVQLANQYYNLRKATKYRYIYIYIYTHYLVISVEWWFGPNL